MMSCLGGKFSNSLIPHFNCRKRGLFTPTFWYKMEERGTPVHIPNKLSNQTTTVISLFSQVTWGRFTLSSSSTLKRRIWKTMMGIIYRQHTMWRYVCQFLRCLMKKLGIYLNLLIWVRGAQAWITIDCDWVNKCRTVRWSD